MSEQSGRYEKPYNPSAEADTLYRECLTILNRIKSKRLSIKLLKACRHFLELTDSYKNKSKDSK